MIPENKFVSRRLATFKENTQKSIRKKVEDLKKEKARYEDKNYRINPATNEYLNPLFKKDLEAYSRVLTDATYHADTIHEKYRKEEVRIIDLVLSFVINPHALHHYDKKTGKLGKIYVDISKEWLNGNLDGYRNYVIEKLEEEINKREKELD